MERLLSYGEVRWLAACAALAAGEAAGFAGARFGPAWPFAAASAALAALYGFGLAVRGWRYAALALAGLALALAAAERRSSALAPGAPSSGPRVMRVSVDGAPSARRGGSAAAWTSFTGRAGPLGVRVVFQARDGDAPPAPGEVWECAGWLARRPAERDGGRLSLWVRGAGTYARRVEGAGRGGFAAALGRARVGLARRAGIGLGHDPSSAALGRAMLLGERSCVDRAARRDFTAAGTMHVFAISGLHVMVVARVLETVLSLLMAPRRIMAFALVPALWLYVAVVGAPPSAVRAAAMTSLLFLAPVFWRRPNGIVAWALTFLAVYAARPSMMGDVGCGLSFAVMLALVLCGRLFRTRGRVSGAVCASIVAWAAGAPIAAHVFGRFTPGGLVSGAALVVVASCDVAAGVLGVVVSFVSESLASYVNNFAALATRTAAGLSAVVARLPGASVEVEPWTLGECAAWYLALALAAWLLVRLRRRAPSGPGNLV